MNQIRPFFFISIPDRINHKRFTQQIKAAPLYLQRNDPDSRYPNGIGTFTNMGQNHHLITRVAGGNSPFYKMRAEKPVFGDEKKNLH